MTAISPATTVFPPMLSVAQAAEILGVGRTLAYELVLTNAWPTPAIRAGRLIRIPQGPLAALMATGSIGVVQS